MEKILNIYGKNTLKNLILFLIIVSVVIGVNYSIILFDMMYPEQPSIYLLNQTIFHFSDIVKFYLHPKLLHTNIPFFRPSGHVLLYQLITPLIGWHNTKAMLIVNLFFLSLVGFFLIKLYELLFPSYRLGGYIAFSMYLMHPALSISRLTIMHFEFAYVFLFILSLYLFIIFCNRSSKKYLLFYATLFFYIFAVTFKEPAIVLGPILIIYFLISKYRNETFLSYIRNTVLNRKTIFILLSIFCINILLCLYLLASWPEIKYASYVFNIHHSLGTVNAFLKDVFGFENNYIPFGYLPYNNLAWRTIIFPISSRLMLWYISGISLLALGILFCDRSNTYFEYKKTIVFIFISIFLTLILPFAWATGAPWHYSLTIIFLGCIAGFCIEYLSHQLKLNSRASEVMIGLMVLILLNMAVIGNHENIKKYSKLELGELGLTLNHNAIHHPPPIKTKLNNESLLIVEDSVVHNDYLMGNSAYPFLLLLSAQDYLALEKKQNAFVLKFHPHYNGNLFRYAYLMPNLKEEIFPFRVENMSEIANEIIYNWMSMNGNIFCVGYDSRGHWRDKTELFKKNLDKEKVQRQLKIYSYQSKLIKEYDFRIMYTHILAFPDYQLCQYTCDQDNQCKGFVYQDMNKIRQCHFYDAGYQDRYLACSHCQLFSKV